MRKYWVEVVHTVVYLRNRSPTLALAGQTPYEAWYGFKPKVNHLRFFGSTCYSLVPKKKRTKLENRSMKCTFLGYWDEKKGYIFLSDGKFIVNRDVIFYETKSNILDEINHILSRLEKKNSKGKGKLNKSRQTVWFEKKMFLQKTYLYQISLLIHLIMKQQNNLLILNLPKNLLQPQIFQMKEEPHFLKILFSIIMVIHILNPINIRSQSGPHNFSKIFIEMK
jgi:hypothetical protein